MFSNLLHLKIHSNKTFLLPCTISYGMLRYHCYATTLLCVSEAEKKIHLSISIQVFLTFHIGKFSVSCSISILC